jgi:hypothetical protein
MYVACRLYRYGRNVIQLLYEWSIHGLLELGCVVLSHFWVMYKCSYDVLLIDAVFVGGLVI